ncbi:MAG: hypothetical protein RPU52_15770 [Candidatus Sedimenticola sp. (ex Thyasira tokunagai)]
MNLTRPIKGKAKMAMLRLLSCCWLLKKPRNETGGTLLGIWLAFKTSLTPLQKEQLTGCRHIIILAQQPLLVKQLITKRSRLASFQAQSGRSYLPDQRWSIYFDGELIIHVPSNTPNNLLILDDQQPLVCAQRQIFNHSSVYIVQVISVNQLQGVDLTDDRLRLQLRLLQQVPVVNLALRLVITDGASIPGFSAYQRYCHQQRQPMRLTATIDGSLSQAIEHLTNQTSDCLVQCSSDEFISILSFMAWVEQYLPPFHRQLQLLGHGHAQLPTSYYFVIDDKYGGASSNPFEINHD